MRGVRSSDGATAACAALRHPSTLVALGLLLLNDHVFEARWPGVVTGKLSDVVWGVVAVPLVALVLAPLSGRLGRRGWATAATTLAATPFVAVNLSPAAAAVAERVLATVVGPSSGTTDPADLLLLPALAVPWLLLTRPASVRPARIPTSRAFTVVVLGVAVLGTTATSCYDGRPRVAQLGTDGGGRVLAVVERGEDSGLALHASQDGGATWSLVDEVPYGGGAAPASQRAIDRVVTASERGGLERCDGATCYRLDPDDEVVVRTVDGRTERIPLADPRRDLLRQRALQGPVCASGDSAPRPRDLELVRTTAGEPRIVVSRGLEGITLVDGDRVEDLALAGAAPVTGSPRFVVVGPELALLAAAATLSWLVSSAVWWQRLARRTRTAGDPGRPRRWAAWLAVVLGVGAAWLVGLLASLAGDEHVGALLACATLTGAIGTGWAALGPAHDQRRLPWRLLGRVTAPALAMALAVLAWGAGLLPSYPSMVLTAAVVAVATAELTRRRLPVTAAPGRAAGPGPPGAAA